MALLENAQILQANILLAFHGQSVTITRGTGESLTTIYSGSAIVAPVLDSNDLEGGYKVGFDACSLTIPASVSTKRGDVVITDTGTWYIAPAENTVHKCDGFNILQKVTIIRKGNASGGNT